MEISLRIGVCPVAGRQTRFKQGSCDSILQVKSRVSEEIHGLIASWALQHFAESPGPLEVVLRLSYFAEVKMETKYQEVHHGSWGQILKELRLGGPCI